ncbi:MAG: ABC transporter permease [Acidobacteriota bacterium]|nr:ABC transporter permease [Acidobacteriota bacterium]
MSRNPFVQLTLVKLREYTREPEALFWVFAFPVLMTLALGIAFRGGDTADVRVGVVRGGASGALVSTLDADPRVIATEVDPAEASALLRDGKVAVIVAAGEPVSYQFDRTRPESAVARFTVDDVLQRAGGRRDAFTPRDEIVVIPGSRYIDWLVPGLLGMNILMTGVWGIAFSIGMSRAKKLLKRLSSTPMRRAHFLGAQIAGRLLFLPIEAGVLLIFSRLAFGVPMAGSWTLLVFLTVLGAVMGGALSLLVASRAKSFEAVSGLINFATLPMWIFSGVFFASSNFPSVMQPFIQALPLTALNDALRAVMLAGATFGDISHEIAVMSAWSIVCFAVALKIFRWQ